MILDNCLSHININLSNVELVFLPSNTTRYLQPLDLGIIRSFKCQYKKQQTIKVVSLINSGCTVLEAYKGITIKDVVVFIHYAWQNVTTQTVINCFNKSPVVAMGSASDTEIVNEKECDDLRELLIDLNISDLQTVEELVTNPDEKITVEALNTEEILAMINLNETTSQIKNVSTDEGSNLLLPTFDDYTKGLEWGYDLIRLL